MFSTFPVWYGALFSGMYPVFVVILLALLLRGVSFEYRNQVDKQRWRDFWDWMSFLGSVIPSFLWGVVMAKLIEGLSLDADRRVVGGLGELFTPFSAARRARHAAAVHAARRELPAAAPAQGHGPVRTGPAAPRCCGARSPPWRSWRSW